MILSSDIYGLIEFFSFLIWIFYGINMICLIILKRRRSNLIKNLEENQTDNTDTKTEKDYHLKVIDFI